MSASTSGKGAPGKAQSKPRLLARSKHEGLKEFYELGDTTTVGRHPSNTIALALDSVSRFHARIDKRGKFSIIQDLNSSNGTFVNGERITQMTLHNNDAVTFGAIEFLYADDTEKSTSGGSVSSHGLAIVDIRDDRSESALRPRSVDVLRQEEASDRSSMMMAISTNEATADRKTLMRLNNRLGTLYRLSELLRELDTEVEEEIIERTLDLIFEAVVADRAVVMVPSVMGQLGAESSQISGDDMRVAAVRYRDQPITEQKVSISRTILDQVLGERVAVLSRDTMMDDRFESSESIVASRVRAVMSVPMVRQDRVVGVIHLESTSLARTFDKEDLEFVHIIASELSSALENTRLHREAEHRQRLAAVGEAMAGVSHNIKNILLLMQGGSDLLNRAMAKQDLESATESWGVVSRGIEKIGRLVREMLDFSSTRQPELSLVDINEMIAATAEDIEDQLVAKGVTLELDLDERIQPRATDEPGLTRTLANLIVNSLEAIDHAEGAITVTTRLKDDGEQLLITVRDNGCGIPPEKQEKVFMPFFTTKGSKGTGLGLPMCKKVVEDLGGTIRVETEVGTGTAFLIMLPRLAMPDHTGTDTDSDSQRVTREQKSPAKKSPTGEETGGLGLSGPTAIED